MTPSISFAWLEHYFIYLFFIKASEMVVMLHLLPKSQGNNFSLSAHVKVLPQLPPQPHAIQSSSNWVVLSGLTTPPQPVRRSQNATLRRWFCALRSACSSRSDSVAREHDLHRRQGRQAIPRGMTRTKCHRTRQTVTASSSFNWLWRRDAPRWPIRTRVGWHGRATGKIWKWSGNVIAINPAGCNGTDSTVEGDVMRCREMTCVYCWGFNHLLIYHFTKIAILGFIGGSSTASVWRDQGCPTRQEVRFILWSFHLCLVEVNTI